MTDHANELRRYSRKIGHPAGDVPSVMLAAADEIERLAARLEAAESEALGQARLNGMGAEREAALLAKLEAAEKERDECNRRRLEAADHFAAQTALMKKKYDDLRVKVAEMEQQEPSGWLRAIDEALVVTHLGVANASDTYEQAKAKLDNLIGFHVDVATDPAVNGGYRLVPIELTHEKEPTMQDALMKFDPATGEERPYPSHATQWRNWHGIAAWLFDPWTGRRRNAYDVGSDVHGLLIAPAGTLGRDMGGSCAEKNNVAGAQPAPSVPMDVIADYLVSISAHLARRDDAKAQAEIGELLKMIASAPKPGASVPEDVMRDAERYRYLRARDDGTAGVGCWIEADGRVCDRGWLYGVQLDSAIDSFIEVLAAAPKPEAKP